MIHVFFPADIIMSWLAATGDERSAATACPTFAPRAATAAWAGTKLPEARDTAAELAWLTRVMEPRADMGPTNPTTECIRHARHTTALSAPEETIPRIMVVCVWPVVSGVAVESAEKGELMGCRIRVQVGGWEKMPRVPNSDNACTDPRILSSESTPPAARGLQLLGSPTTKDDVSSSKRDSTGSVVQWRHADCEYFTSRCCALIAPAAFQKRSLLVFGDLRRAVRRRRL